MSPMKELLERKMIKITDDRSVINGRIDNMVHSETAVRLGYQQYVMIKDSITRKGASK